MVMDAYRQEVAGVAVALETDAQHGLRDREALARLAIHGRNELAAEKPRPGWRRFLAQFQNILVLLLLAAAAVSGGLWIFEGGSTFPYEAIAIFAVVLLNAAMGYVQESRAEDAVAALKNMTADHAEVIRDGERRRVPATELVPGDVVLLEEGDTVPADARLVVAVALQTAEASLTGESQPVSKDTLPIPGEAALGDRDNMVFSGTTVTYGRGRGVVTATGMQTEMGRIAGLLKASREEATPLQRELDRLGTRMAILVTLLAVVMIAAIVLVGHVRGFAALVDVLILGVALAVAAVPEGLPAVVTAALSVGVQRMARRHAIVRHLASVETLGSATVIASDKTGTFTRNEMTVRIVATASGRVSFGGSGYAPDGDVRRDDGGPIEGALRLELDRALAAADRANNAAVHLRDGCWTVYGDPTEGALLVAARKAGLRREALDERHPRVGEVPFSSQRKLMSTVHHDTERSGQVVVFVKGAPDVLLTQCTLEVVGGETRPLTAERRADILSLNETLAGDAYRTLGVAVRVLPREEFDADIGIDCRIEKDLSFAGLIGMIDPPRPEAADAVARARGAGIRTVMITGDHPRTAAVIARELGITDGERVVTGAELGRLTGEALTRTVAEVSVYARVDPEHKMTIVEELRRGGAIVAMTGDGVNDAPALKRADIGVAMGITGTDVSKEAADIVLADDNFASIVAAVEEGRRIFANIRKFLTFLLSSNFGEVLTMFLGVLLSSRMGVPSHGDGVVLPLLATQILWINLVTDGAPALALGVDPAHEGQMRRAPRPPGEGVITGRMWRNIGFVGIVVAVGTLFVFDAALPGGFVEGAGTLPYARTMAFTTLMLFQLFNVFNARSSDRSAFDGLFTNPWLWGAVGLSLALQVLVVYVPLLQQAFGTVALTFDDWLRCALVGSSALWLMEMEKFLARALGRRRRGSPPGSTGSRGPVSFP